MLTNQERFDYLQEIYAEIDDVIDQLVAAEQPLPDKLVNDFTLIVTEILELSQCNDVDTKVAR
jgi:hypothetical protein